MGQCSNKMHLPEVSVAHRLACYTLNKKSCDRQILGWGQLFLESWHHNECTRPRQEIVWHVKSPRKTQFIIFKQCFLHGLNKWDGFLLTSSRAELAVSCRDGEPAGNWLLAHATYERHTHETGINKKRQFFLQKYVFNRNEFTKLREIEVQLLFNSC